ncbi:hypothetical protein [Photobacterium sp. 1_MG-2023]|uniref:hypothetical protein n=1 Tax=Photobacterium sp. 1_MG-2023 TaxID=3062646 RepID=UPI0026E320C0|nr:hypothetical protein [Photobacterium sp. 1_MG-2023]MDO6706680.1 hypothetical protein [Photobacterium sp. 1_MG-2023]
MFSDFISASIEEFQSDCLQLCSQHYPTVHNRGMRDRHLGRLMCRRILATLEKAGVTANLEQRQTEDVVMPPVFRIQTPDVTLWVIAHRLQSANRARRNALLQAVDLTLKQLNRDENNQLLLLTDHWFDRSKASKQLPSWWLGQMPDNIQGYLQDGIKLLPCELSLCDQLQLQFGLLDGKPSLHHPLKRLNSQQTLHRYAVMTAYFSAF